MKRKYTAVILAAALSISLMACNVSEKSSSAGTSYVTSAADSESISGTASDTASAAASDTVSEITSVSAGTVEAASDDEMFKEKDIDTSYSDEVTITLKDGASNANGSGVNIEGDTITITAPGTYLFSGTLSDGQIIVDAGDDEKVHIILDGVSVSNSGSAAIYSVSTDKLIITTAEGSENLLASTGEYDQTGDSSVDAAVFSKTDLSLNGIGTLTVTSEYGHAIVSKDDLVITSGTYNVTAAKQGLSGKDSIRIAGGVFNIDAGTDALHSDNDEDTDKGYIYIIGGTFYIKSGDDAVHTSGDLTIKNGEFNIENSHEGLEGHTVNIEGGSINIAASDDGINAAAGDDSSGYGQNSGEMFAADSDAYIKISGGDITISSFGDSIDSNGSLYISGGTIMLNGPENEGNGPLDYDGDAQITGGTIVAVGSSGMAMNFGSGSSQCSVLQYLSSAQGSGSEITLTDSEGNVLISAVSEKEFSSVLISCPDLAAGNTYTLKAGSETFTIELTDTIYGYGSGFGTGGMPGTRHNGNVPFDQKQSVLS